MDRRKQARLRATAELYLAEHPEEARQPRFDVAEIYAPQGTATRRPGSPGLKSILGGVPDGAVCN